MKEYVALMVLVLVILAGLYSLDYAYSYSEDAVFGKHITGAQTATVTKQCEMENRKAICILENGGRIEYTKRGECLLGCTAGLGTEPEEPPAEAGTSGSCVDNDGDGFGIGEACEVTDCDDSNEKLTNNCNVCGNVVVEKSNGEECDDGENNGLWSSDVSRTCSSGSVVRGQSRCTAECKIEREFFDCPEGEEGEIEEGEVIEVKEPVCEKENRKIKCSRTGKEYTKRGECLLECTAEAEVVTPPEPGEEPREEKADLVVSIAEAPNEMIKGNFYKVKVLVTNRGGESTLASRPDKSKPAEFSTVLLLEKGNFRTILGKRKITNLDRGERKTITFGFIVLEALTSGGYELKAVADSQREIDESDEDNNDHSKEVNVRIRLDDDGPIIEPDLCIEEEAGKVICLSGNPQENYGSDFDLCEDECREEMGAEGPDLKVEIVNPPSEVVTGQFHDITVKVTNVGKESVTTSFSTALDFVNAEDSNQRSRIGNFGIRLLSPGRSIENTFERWGIPATTSENYKFEARADTENRVSGDKNRENNNDVKPIMVKEGIGQPQNCVGEGGQVQMGTRTDSRYCGSDGQLTLQKANKIACQNSFECRTNICAAGVCVNEATLNVALGRI